MYSLFNRVRVGHSFGEEIIEELIEQDIIYIVDSREAPLKEYKKQLLKKELRHYLIEPKIYFKKPFIRFWFLLVEPYIYKYSMEKILSNIDEKKYILSSLIFEQLSIEILKEEFKAKDSIVEIASYWDVNSEFDIYAKTKSNKFILGECKYKNRPITKAELLKLKSKAKASSLDVDKFALFSKSGYSNELNKINSNNLTLYYLDDLKKLL